MNMKLPESSYQITDIERTYIQGMNEKNCGDAELLRKMLKLQ